MNPLPRVEGRVAVLDRPDVDTDQIIPKQFLKRVERTGYGAFLFHDWMKDPAFELNRPENDGASILVAGRNFGCGSSREHAAWALEDYGFKAVLAPSFGDIFRSNAVKSGLAPIVVDVQALSLIRNAAGRENALLIDLERLEIRHPGGLIVTFTLDPYDQETLVGGLDDIARTLQREPEITGYEALNAARFDAAAL
ncbi:MAG TPA: 3-isopropylmalate dehydratase small subunit [Gaiellaceae bacterium]|nr:3-isopropylmalate dehydratase small subunit [Gaiellaceae bacterium]